MDTKIKHKKRINRHKRARAVIKGTKERPRLNVFRSSKHIYAQLIDDAKGVTLISLSDVKEKMSKEPKSKIAYRIGETLAKEAMQKGIKKVLFDRGGYKYHGRVKALAEGARKGGLNF